MNKGMSAGGSGGSGGAPLDLSEMRRFIMSLIPSRRHDDGSYGPLMIRYAWHLCGTYDAASGNGGSQGCTMRFAGEKNDPENAGFEKAETLVDQVQEAFPGMLSRADVQIFFGGLAFEAMGGPRMKFRYGRKDYTEEEAREKYPSTGGCPFGDGEFNPNGSRLPAADLGKNPSCPHASNLAIREKPTIDAVRNTFYRMGLDDRETVCLIVLGHQFGRCHPDVSGYEHPWYIFDPTAWNIYESGLGYLSAYFMGQYQEEKSTAGKRQFNMHFGGGEPFMMLVSDMCLLWDSKFRKWLEYYNQNRRQFRVDAVKAWSKLTELGCQGLRSPTY